MSKKEERYYLYNDLETLEEGSVWYNANEEKEIEKNLKKGLVPVCVIDSDFDSSLFLRACRETVRDISEMDGEMYTFKIMKERDQELCRYIIFGHPRVKEEMDKREFNFLRRFCTINDVELEGKFLKVFNFQDGEVKLAFCKDEYFKNMKATPNRRPRTYEQERPHRVFKKHCEKKIPDIFTER